jgi:DNA primase
MRFSPQLLADIKSQVDLVALVNGYVSLKKEGSLWVTRCPFHSEKTASFKVNPVRGVFKCYGCNVGGDVFAFVRLIEGCSFPEAVRIVAERYGIPILVSDGLDDGGASERTREATRRVNEWAAEYFERALMEPGGALAREYIERRGITDDTRKLFRIGFDPDKRDELESYLRERGASADDLASSGLFTLPKSGSFNDLFRGRVMFPITDSEGRLVAFGGRLIREERENERKYMNSSETAIYTKGRHLYGLALAKGEIHKRKYAILVEGYLDLIVLFQEGVRNVVASLGTSLTGDQARLLRRYMDPPKAVVSFDPDPAGQRATLKSINTLLVEGFSINTLRLPAGKDPDEFVLAHGADAFRALLKTTQPHVEFVIDTAIAAHDITRSTEKTAAINEMLPTLARIRNKITRAHYINLIASRLRIESQLLFDELRTAILGGKSELNPDQARAAESEFVGTTVAERQLLEAMLADESLCRVMVPGLIEDDYAELATGAIFAALVYAINEGLDLDHDTLAERIESDSTRALLLTLMMGDGAQVDDEDVRFKRASDALSCLRERTRERTLAALQLALIEAERLGDEALVLRLCQQKVEIQSAAIPVIVRPSRSEQFHPGLVEVGPVKEFSSKEPAVG